MFALFVFCYFFFSFHFFFVLRLPSLFCFILFLVLFVVHFSCGRVECCIISLSFSLSLFLSFYFFLFFLSLSLSLSLSFFLSFFLSLSLTFFFNPFINQSKGSKNDKLNKNVHRLNLGVNAIFGIKLNICSSSVFEVCIFGIHIYFFNHDTEDEYAESSGSRP